MDNLILSSATIGIVISLLAYEIGLAAQRKWKLAILNPLLISIALVIVFLVVFHVDYDSYNMSAKYLSYLLTPATVCLAIPLYLQLDLLKKNIVAIMTGFLFGGTWRLCDDFCCSYYYYRCTRKYVGRIYLQNVPYP